MDNAEFERRIADCENALKRYVYFKTPTKADGDDVLQETLFAAYRCRDSVKNADSFKPWLLRIAASKCADFYRERAKRSELPLDDVPESALTYSRYGLTVKHTVRDTLDSLSEHDARILRMFFLRGIPQAEIARVLDIPEGTVKSRLSKARSELKLLLSEEENDYEHEVV